LITMVRTSRWRVLTCAAIGAALLLGVCGCDWLQPGFNGGGSNANPIEPTLTARTVGSLTQRYTLGSSNVAYGSPIVARGVLYASSHTANTGEVSAFRASDGASLWTTTVATGAGVLPSNVAYASGLVFVNAAGAISALDARTGAVRWTDPIPGLHLADPAIDGGKIFAAAVQPVNTSGVGETANVIAIDPVSGSTLWTSPTFTVLGEGFDIGAGPFAAAGYVSVTDIIPQLPPYSFETRWFHESDGSAAGNTGPLIEYRAADGLIYATSPVTSLPSGWIDPTSGALVVSPAPTVDAVAANLAVGAGAQAVDAYDPRTAAARWTAPLPSNTTPPSIVIAGTLVYVVATNGTGSTLYALDTASGTQVAAVPVVGGGQLAVAEGTVFVTVNGTITAYAPTS
jgi:outer membrane protein assembly factor BamB